MLSVAMLMNLFVYCTNFVQYFQSKDTVKLGMCEGGGKKRGAKGIKTTWSDA